MKTETHSRSTLNLIDIIGISGGFASIMSLACGLLVRFIATKWYFYDLNSYLYQVDASAFVKNSQPTNFRNSNLNNIEMLPFENGSKIYEEQKASRYEINTSREDDFKCQNGFDKSYHNKKTSAEAKSKRIELVNQSIASMNARRMYNYSTKDFFYNL